MPAPAMPRLHPPCWRHRLTPATLRPAIVATIATALLHGTLPAIGLPACARRAE